MKRLLRFIVLGGTALILLAALGLGILLATFNPNDYKDQLSLAVQKATGRRPVFLDDIEMSLFPAPGLRTGRMALQDVGGFGAEPFLSVESASLILAVEPLWDRIIEIDEVALNGPVLKLATNPAGVHNWQYGFTREEQALPGKEAREGVTPLDDEGAALDAKTAEKARVTLRLRRIICDGAKFSYYDMRSGRSWSGNFNSFSLSDARLDAETPLVLAGKVKDDVTGQQADFSLKAAVTASGQGGAAARIEQLEIVADGFGLVPITLAAKGVATYDPGSRSFGLSRLEAAVTVPPRQGEEEQPLRTEVSGDFFLTGTEDNGRALLKGKLLLGELDLDLLSARLNPPAAVESAEGVRGAPNMTRARVAKPQGSQNRGMLPGGAPSAQSQEAPGSEALAGQGVASAAPLSAALDTDLELLIQELTIRSISLSKGSLRIRSRDGEVDLPWRFEVFDGSVEGTARADYRPDTPRFSLKGTLRRVNLEKATRKLAAKYTVSGYLEGGLEVSGQGRHVAEIVHSLAGKASFQVLNGEVKGFSLIPPGLPQLKPVPADFPFTRISASAGIVQGVATSKNILLQSPVLTGQGGGSIHLAHSQMDLGIDFRLGGKPPAVPVTIGGPYSALSCRVDMPTFMRNVAESAVNAPEDAAKGLLRGVGGLLFR